MKTAILTLNNLLQAGLAAILCAALVASLHAEPRTAGGDDAARKAQYLLRQMQAELQQEKTENARLQGELDGLKKSQGELKQQLETSEQKLTGSSGRNAALSERLRRDGDKYRELMDRYRDTVAELRKARFKVAYMEQAVQERNAWISTCQKNNDELYTVNSELLDAYRDKGVMASLSQAVPVTGLARVRVENRVEEYRYRLDDLKMLDFKGGGDYDTASVKPHHGGGG